MAKIYLWKMGQITDNVATCIVPSRIMIDNFRETLKKALTDRKADDDFHHICGPDITLEIHDSTLSKDFHVVDRVDIDWSQYTENDK